MNRLLVSITLCAGLAASGANAGLMTFTERLSETSVLIRNASGGVVDEESDAYTGFGAYSRRVALVSSDLNYWSASQSSSLASNAIAFSGFAAALSGPPDFLWNVASRSRMHVTFSVSREVEYSLTGMARITLGETSALTWTLRDLDTQQFVFFGSVGFQPGQTPVDLSGVLGPGTYEIAFSVDSSASVAVPALAWASSDLAFRVVPGPGASAAMMFAVAVAGRRRR